MNRDLAGIHAAGYRARSAIRMAEHYRILHRRVVEDALSSWRIAASAAARSGAFVAVGADHLYGEEGMLALIEKQGHRVERAY